MTLATAVSLIAVPIGLGALVGFALRLGGRRLRGFVAAIGCLVVPAAAVVGLVMRYPIIGLWDAGLEGLLLGVGVLGSAHRVLEEGRNVLLLATSLIVSLLLLELGSRLFLP